MSNFSPPVGALSQLYLNRIAAEPDVAVPLGSAEEAVKNLPFLHGELPTELKTLKESTEAVAGARWALSLRTRLSPIWAVDWPRPSQIGAHLARRPHRC